MDAPIPFPRRVAVLGATGSIGGSALDVIARHPERLRATVLAAGSNVQALLVDGPQRLWVGTSRELLLFEDGRFQAIPSTTPGAPERNFSANAAMRWSLDAPLSALNISAITLPCFCYGRVLGRWPCVMACVPSLALPALVSTIARNR